MAYYTDSNGNQYEISDELLKQYDISTDVPKNTTIKGAEVWGIARLKNSLDSSQDIWLTRSTTTNVVGPAEYLWITSNEK